jgi:HEAT repeat protein
LADKDVAVRRQAAKALFQIGRHAKASTPALLTAVKDADGEVRAMAAQALGRVAQGTADAVPTLVEALGDQQANVRAAAAVSLSEIWLSDKAAPAPRSDRAEERAEKHQQNAGPPLPPRLGKTPESEEAKEREREAGTAVDLTPRLPPRSEPAAKAAVPELTKALRDDDAPVRAAAAAALGETGPLAQTAVGALSQILQKDADNNARVQACLALGNIGSGAKAAVPALAQSLLHDKSLGVRVNAAGSLGQIARDPEKAVPALVEAYLTDPEPEVRAWSSISLGRYKSAAPKLAQNTLETLVKDPRKQQLPEFQSRVDDFRKLLAGKLTEKSTPAERGSPPRSK